MTGEASAHEEKNVWIFNARLLPERSSVTLRDLKYSMEAQYPDLGLRFRLERVAIIDAQIVARVAILEGQTDVYTLRNILSNHLRHVADLIGFLSGRHLDVEITSAACTSSPDDWVIFGNTLPIFYKEEVSIETEMLSAAFEDSHLPMALSDFRKAIQEGTSTGFYCYRAIETIMQALRVDGEDNAKSWERMRRILHVKRDAIDYVKSYADDRRHGRGSKSITDGERQKIFKVCHAVIDRYLTLRTMSIAELPSDSFPDIDGSTF